MGTAAVGSAGATPGGATRGHGDRTKQLALVLSGAVLGSLLVTTWLSLSRTCTVPSSVAGLDHASDRAAPRGVQKSEACGVSILMIEDRLQPDGTFHNERGHNPLHLKVIEAAVALNYLYAKQHNYTFTIYHPKQGTDNSSLLRAGYSLQWCKVPLLEQLLSEEHVGEGDAQCHWFLFVDSDAIVRESHAQVPSTLNDMAHRQRGASMPDLSLVVASEGQVTDGLVEVLRRNGLTWGGVSDRFNTGVLFVQRNMWSRQFVRTWAVDAWTRCSMWKAEIYHEQSCVQELVQRASKDRVLVVDGIEINTPWGRFISHFWGGSGGWGDVKTNSVGTAWKSNVAAQLEQIWAVNGYSTREAQRTLLVEALNHSAVSVC